MAESMRGLTILRRSLKVRLTNFKKFVAKFEILDFGDNKKNVSSLTIRVGLMESAFDEFNTVQLQIEQLTTDEDIEKQLCERTEFEENAIEILAAAKEILREKGHTALVGDNEDIESNANNSFRSIHSRDNNSNQRSHGFRNVKLPTISIPSFDGTSDRWLEFSDLYRALIHDDATIHDTEKFYYLKTALTGDAADVIQSINANATNYQTAWETLCERYQNTDLIIDAHVKNLFELPPIHRENAHALRTLLDSVNKNIRSLQNLGEPTKEWNTLLIYIVSSKLDSVTRKDWEIRRKTLNNKIQLDNLTAYLREKWEILEKINRDKFNASGRAQSHPSNYSKRTITNFTSTSQTCKHCNEDYHPLYSCKEFLNLSIHKRNIAARKMSLCINCLRDNHKVSECKSPISCRRCYKKHNTVLHYEPSHSQYNQSTSNQGRSNTSDVSKQIQKQKQTNVEVNNKPSTSNGEANVVSSHSFINAQVILSTAVVNIEDIHGKLHKCRAFLDPGSQTSYITEGLCRRLGLQVLQSYTKISGVNESKSNSKSRTYTKIHSIINDYIFNINLLILRKITEELPLISFNKTMVHIPDVPLADPNFNVSSEIDVLLGSDVFWALLTDGRIKLGENKPTYQNTQLGWIIGGPLTKKGAIEPHVTSYSSVRSLEDLVRRFWEIENVENVNIYTPEEKMAENIFTTSTKRTNTGRFVVRIPFKQQSVELGESREIAERRFYALERKLMSNIQLKQQYVQFMTEYLNLRHMSLINKPRDESYYYMPHHAVLKEDSLSTKLRVVFDASARTSNGRSLNDIQLVGPVIQSDLYSILLRFRMKRFVLSADISKMYRQILISDDLRSYQLILWRDNPDKPLETYQLNTVTYGTASAPYLATRCIKQLAIESKSTYPIESSIIEHDFYVDDLLTGTDDIKTLKSIKTNITTILKSAGFELRKFLSNSIEIFDSTIDDTIDPLLNLTNEEHKALGIRWNAKQDTLNYCICVDNSNNLVCTKRSILSTTAKIFDPLGLLTPLIIKAKLIIQGLWQLKLSWDDILPDNIHQTWRSFLNEISQLETLNIPRFVASTNVSKFIIHGFSDASEKAYGACVYIKCINSNHSVSVNLLTSKSRVAPLKQISLPRLELCGALLLMQLVQKVKASIERINKIDKIHYWTDSNIVLCWLNAPSTRWKTFVANRVSEIQSTIYK